MRALRVGVVRLGVLQQPTRDAQSERLQLVAEHLRQRRAVRGRRFEPAAPALVGPVRDHQRARGDHKRHEQCRDGPATPGRHERTSTGVPNISTLRQLGDLRVVHADAAVTDVLPEHGRVVVAVDADLGVATVELSSVSEWLDRPYAYGPYTVS